MSVCDRNEPRITGAPGRISWVSDSPASCLDGLLHQRRRHGRRRHRAHQQERRDHVHLPGLGVDDHRLQHPRVEAQRRVGVDHREDARLGRVGSSWRPNRMSVISSVSRAASPVITAPMYGLSVSVWTASSMSRWRESSGRSFGSHAQAAGRVQLLERLRQPAELLEVGHRRLAPLVALAHERRPLRAAEEHVAAADPHGAGRVAGGEVVLAAAPSRPARARSRDRSARSGPRPAGPRRGTARPRRRAGTRRRSRRSAAATRPRSWPSRPRTAPRSGGRASRTRAAGYLSGPGLGRRDHGYPALFARTTEEITCSS